LKPVFLTLALLLGSSSVLAAEHYTEVWNPPEAQTVKGKTKSRTATSTASATAKKKRKSATSVKQVADKAAVDSQQNAVPRPKAVAPRQTEPVIPRKIGPNGQVMRV
jgi:hypothetical protein